MEKLDKKWWEAAMEDYPDAAKEFLDFIDEYKKDNNWDDIFLPGIKFHDLPIQMQVSIWIHFLIEIREYDDFHLDSQMYTDEGMWEWVTEQFRDTQINFDLAKAY